MLRRVAFPAALGCVLASLTACGSFFSMEEREPWRAEVEAQCLASGQVHETAGIRIANPVALIDGRFRTAPGMFSFDRIDAGSKLLVDNLPKDLRGNIADFCAGWGYVAAEIAASSPGITGLDLYEADFDALEAAKGNIGVTTLEPGFFWIDLLSEPVERRYDAIVMNPPFHRSRAAEPEIGAGMIQAAGKALKPGGRLFMVANRQLPYEPVLKAAFSSHAEIARDGMFKVFAARR